MFVYFGGQQGEADGLNCNPLQRVGIPFFRFLASSQRTLLLLLVLSGFKGTGRGKPDLPGKTSSKRVVDPKSNRNVSALGQLNI